MTSATGTLAVDAVIFDMDGVLVDSEPLHTRATKRLLADCGPDWDERESADHIGLTDVESFAALKLRHHLAGDPLDLAARWAERTIVLLEQHARPLPGVPSVPLTLCARGYRLALASSSRPRVIAATLEVIGARHVFEVGCLRGRGPPRQAVTRRLPRSGPTARRKPRSLPRHRRLAPRRHRRPRRRHALPRHSVQHHSPSRLRPRHRASRRAARRARILRPREASRVGRGAPRLCRGAPNVGGMGGHVGAPMFN